MSFIGTEPLEIQGTEHLDSSPSSDKVLSPHGRTPGEEPRPQLEVDIRLRLTQGCRTSEIET